jgi:peptidoglycan/LPS O-acetylase OafA/YrhL
MIAICLLYRLEITNFYNDWDATKRIIYTENLLGRFDQFAFGILASLITLKIKTAKTIGLAAIVCGTSGLIFGMNIFEEYQSGFRDVLTLQVFLHSFIGLSAALLIFGLSNSFVVVSKIIGNKVFAFLGLISYSFYIWHYLITEAVLRLSQKVDLFGLEFLISFLTTLALSSLTYYLIEKRFLAKKKYS